MSPSSQKTFFGLQRKAYLERKAYFSEFLY